MTKLKELYWFTPLLCLALITLFMLHPWPVFPHPSSSRIMVDAGGKKVVIPLPFRGIVVDSTALIDFLSVTHAPEALLKMGGPQDREGFADSLMGHIYPQLAKNASLWNSPSDIESVLAHDVGGVYIGGDDRFGLAAISVVSDWTDTERVIESESLYENEAIGHPERARDAITSYRQRVADVKNDLHAQHFRDRPSMISLVNDTNDWTRLWASGGEDQDLGTKDATEGMMTLGRGSEAERILAMNPDIIILRVGSFDDFMHDPRWQGLKVIKTKRVYENAVALDGYSFDVDNGPLGLRWSAEVVRGDYLQPKMREIMRDYYMKTYEYAISDDKIDKMLDVRGNKHALGYARFERHVQAVSSQVSPR